MAIPTRTLDEILRRQTAHFRTSFPGLPLGVKKFLGRTSRAVSLGLWGLQKALEDTNVDIVPSSKSSDQILSDWATLLGLPNGQGGFGRLLPTAASGGAASLTGTKGTIYPDGIIATAENGTTQVALSGPQTIPGTPPGLGLVVGQFVATTEGPDGNLAVGSVLTWQSPPSGADPTFVLTSPLTNGNSIESNSDVFARIVARLQTPPRGGVAEDYRIWAQTISGIVDVFVYPKRSGTGTVDLVITSGGSGQGRAASAALRTMVQDAVDVLRPVAMDGANVLLPYMPNGQGKLVRVRVKPSQNRYKFDWDDTIGGPFTVALYTPGPPAKILLNLTAPPSLTNAITSFIAGTGPMPRIQVLSTGSVVNPGIGCVSFVPVGFQTELTLETVPSTWVTPTIGDTIFAFGPAVSGIANGILNFADSLGPSRVGTFGDTLTPWQDILTISGIIRIAEDSFDTDGTRIISEVLVGGATINGAAADVQGSDFAATGPEIIYLLHVAVTQ